ncbi:MAG: hypothetical protein RIQ81_1961 [Pseudomonadota bacterium]
MLQYRELTPALLARPLTGFGLDGQSIEDLCQGGQACLLVFLPQLGSAFAREAVQDVFNSAKNDPNYPSVVFFHHDSEDQGNLFFEKHWKRAKAVADPEMYFYREFGVPAAGLWELANPLALARAIKAAVKGHLPKKPSSDLWSLPGTFVVSGNRILWSHNSRHAGDFPAFNKMRPLVQGLLAQDRKRPGKNSETRGKLPRAS